MQREDQENESPAVPIQRSLQRVAAWARSARRLALQPEARADALWEWRRRRGLPAPLPRRVKSILVLCHGNICRSPYAERLLAKGLPGMSVRSAGFAADDASPADADAERAAARRGVSLADHRSRPLRPGDLEGVDLILAMEGRHLRRLAREGGIAPGRAHLLGDSLGAPPFTIPDPWGTSDAFFDRVFAQIDAATAALVRRLGGSDA